MQEPYPQPPAGPVVPRHDYPLTFRVDYPERPLNRLSSFFRLLWIIPIAIVIGGLSAVAFSTGARGPHNAAQTSFYLSLGGAGMVFVPVLLMLVFRAKYPRWWFDWNLNLSRFTSRVGAYGLLLRDEYPSTDEEQAVHLDFEYPDATTLDRILPIFKWLFALPHYIVLLFLGIGVCFCTVIAWFSILFTGRYPRGLFDYVVGVMRWQLRVQAYAFLLITDKYPPFSLSE
jgi:hypothetical protein